MPSDIRKLKRWLMPLASTPLHPQWLVMRGRTRTLHWIKHHSTGTVLDIGCGDARIRDAISKSTSCIGIDYPPTMALGYQGRPDILADAARLPISKANVDTVLLLDVLEHFAQPELAVAEASRIIRPGGKCLIHVPFLYPLHDEPHDYHRWTKHGLQHLLKRHGFQVTETTPSTNPAETGATLLCIALAKGLLDALRLKSPVLLLAPLILAFVPAINIFGWLLGKLLPFSEVMPSGYLCLGIKKSGAEECKDSRLTHG